MQKLAALPGEPPSVAMGMTYGNPSIDHALQKLQSAGVRRLVVLPLYPQYSATTTAAALDRVDAALARWRAPPERLLIEDYHAEADHIAALAASIAAARAPFDLLFSFHGIPRPLARMQAIRYGEQCQATARLAAARLALPAERWSVAFQSRVGRARWLEPYTEDRLRELARAGVQRLAVACPGFAVDCLENAGGDRDPRRRDISYPPAADRLRVHPGAQRLPRRSTAPGTLHALRERGCRDRALPRGERARAGPCWNRSRSTSASGSRR